MMIAAARSIGIDFCLSRRSRVQCIQHLLLFLCFIEAAMVLSSVVNSPEATDSSAPRPSVPLRNREMHAPVQVNLGQSNKILKKRRKAISFPQALLFIKRELITSVFFTMLDTCTAALALFILLLRGGIEPNPGPCSCSFATITGKFTMTKQEASELRICFAHRKALGVQMDTSKTCVMPGHTGGYQRRPTRNVTFEMAKQLTESLGYPVPVAAKICNRCREQKWPGKGKAPDAMDISEKPDPTAMETEHSDEQPSTSGDRDEQEHDTHQPESFAEVLISQHRPERKAAAATRERQDAKVSKADATKQLKNFNDAMTNLSTSMVDQQLPRPIPLTHRLTKPLADYAVRAQRRIRKCATTSIIAVLDNISPGGATELWAALQADHAVEQELGMDDALHPPINDASLANIAQIYLSATTRQMQLQILSILVGLGPKSAVLRHIPNLSHRQYWNAIRYKRRVGPGIPVGTKKIKRVRVSYEQIEHFVMFMTKPEYMQDVAFGCRMIKYESGIKQEVPNTVRTLCTSRLIAHYRNYCTASNHPLPIPSNTTLYKLMSVVGGKQLKSLQGLDNIQADGMEGFSTLHNTLKEIEALGFDSIDKTITIDKTRTRLTNFKRYLQLDYHCHIEQSNTPCTTHCPSFALSESSDSNEFKTLCTDHEHHLVCDRCMDFPLLEDEFQQILNKIPDVEHLRETKDIMNHNVLKSFEQIAAYRSHIIRYHNQNRAKLDILRNLQSDECYCIADYAMKWLPKKFYERQKDYFGRRGISWHFSCMVTRCEKDGDFDIHSFVHIQGSSPQNWFSVASALEHSMQWLKGLKPHVTKIYFRSDRASNYHSTHLISCLPDICERQGFTAMAYHFSEPQTGKDLADRKIAGAKAHAHRYLNEQHDIETAADLFTALTSSGGVRGCYVVNGEVQHSQNNFQDSTISWPNFNSYSNFVYNGDEIKAFKSYNVGTGKSFSRQSFLNKKTLQPTALSVISSAEPTTEKGKTGFIAKYKKSHKAKPETATEEGPATPTATSIYSESAKEPEADPSQAVGAESDELPQIADEVLYNCTEPECCSMFGSQEALDQHLDQGEHQIELQLHSIYDTARAIYVDKLTELKDEYGTTIQKLYPGYYEERPQESMGWALPGKRKIVRKTPKVKEWLKKVFSEGLKKNIKKSGAEVAKLMKKLRNDDGSLFFAPDEWLDKDRITAYFNGLHAINMNLLKEDTFDQAQKDDEDQVTEEAVPTTTEAQAEVQAANYAVAEDGLAEEVHSEVGLQHPVTFDEIDLCHHRLNNTLGSLQNATLYAAIEEFGETIAKRSNKQQLTSKLTDILLGCSCKTEP